MVWARFSVSDVDATPTSARFEVSAGMRSGNGVSTYLGLHAERRGEIVAGVDVVADRLVLLVARAHRREVEHDGAAQLA